LTGASYEDAARAGVTASDSRASVDWKIEEEKGRQLRDRLSKFGPDTDYSKPQPKGRKRVIILAIFSFAFIGNCAWRVFIYVVENMLWEKGEMLGPRLPYFFWKVGLALAAVVCGALLLWLLSIKFFKWLCYQKRILDV